jgi:hypothetical protein
MTIVAPTELKSPKRLEACCTEGGAAQVQPRLYCAYQKKYFFNILSKPSVISVQTDGAV